MASAAQEDVPSESDPLRPSPDTGSGPPRNNKWMWVVVFLVMVGSIIGIALLLRTSRFGRSVLRSADPINTSLNPPIALPSVLILVQTFPGMYTTRIKEIRETWGKRVVEKSDNMKMFFVSNNSTEGMDDVWLSKCPAGYLQSVCKIGDTLEMAYEYLHDTPEGKQFEWLLFGDDDIYLLPDNMQHVIIGLGPDASRKRTIFGVLGCGLGHCSGFCGGGMYLLSRMMVQVMATEYNKTRFSTVKEEFIATSDFCGGYHDIALGSIALRNRTNVTLTSYPVLPYVYHITPQELNETFYRKNPFTWLYHYPSRGNMHFIHNETARYRTNMELHEL